MAKSRASEVRSFPVGKEEESLSRDTPSKPKAAPGARTRAPAIAQAEAPIVEPTNVDFELEERFLAWCLIDPAALESVTVGVFWLLEHRVFFDVLAELQADRVWSDFGLVTARLRVSGRLEQAGGEVRILEMFERVEPVGNGARAAQRLTRLLALRDARAAALHAAVAIDAGHAEPALASLREAARRLKAAQ